MPKPPRFTLKTRHKRYARLAASVAIGAVLRRRLSARLITGGLRPSAAARSRRRKKTRRCSSRSPGCQGSDDAEGQARAATPTNARRRSRPPLANASSEPAPRSPARFPRRRRWPPAVDAVAHAASGAAHRDGGSQLPLADPRPICRWCRDWIDPRFPRRLYLCRRSGRYLSDRARRAVAGPWPGAVDQEARRPLGGDDAEGIIVSMRDRRYFE